MSLCVGVTAVESKCLFAVCVDVCVYVFRVESEGLRFRSATKLLRSDEEWRVSDR